MNISEILTAIFSGMSASLWCFFFIISSKRITEAERKINQLMHILINNVKAPIFTDLKGDSINE